MSERAVVESPPRSVSGRGRWVGWLMASMAVLASAGVVLAVSRGESVAAAKAIAMAGIFALAAATRWRAALATLSVALTGMLVLSVAWLVLEVVGRR